MVHCVAFEDAAEGHVALDVHWNSFFVVAHDTSQDKFVRAQCFANLDARKG